MSWTIEETIDAVATTLGATVGIKRTNSYDAIVDTINDSDCPMLQVYLDEMTVDPTSDTAVSTIGAIRQYRIPVIADLIIGPQNQVNERMAELIGMTTLILDKLELQIGSTKFGKSHIRSFSFQWTRVTHVYNEINYIGARMVITLRCW